MKQDRVMNDFFIHKWEQLISLWRGDGEDNIEVSGDNGETERMLREQFEVRQAIRGLEHWSFDVEQGWRKVRPRSLRLRLVRLSKYAAMLVVIFSLTYYFVRPGDEKKKSEMAQSGRIEPGKLQAELQLATGERLVLDVHQVLHKQENNGIEIVNDTANGKVYYRTVGAAVGDSMKFNTLVVPKGGEYSMELPDGTVVWINSESSLRFPETFARECREVYLKGEAYFEVKKDKDKPFHVYTELGDVRVLGTSFNVSAYPGNKSWQTTLVEGAVMIVRGQEKVLMKPNEQYEIDERTGVGVLKRVSPELYTSWRDGKFYFKAYTFEELVERLERWYDFKMFYMNENIKSRRFSGVVNKHQPLQEMLKFLEMTSDVRFSVKGNVVTASLDINKEN